MLRNRFCGHPTRTYCHGRFLMIIRRNLSVIILLYFKFLGLYFTCFLARQWHAIPSRINNISEMMSHSIFLRPVPVQALKVPGGWGSLTSTQSALVRCKAVRPMHWAALPHKEIFLLHSVQQNASGLIFRTSRSCSDVTFRCHHTCNSSRFTFHIYVHSWRFALFHSLQPIPLYILTKETNTFA
jgi:hypothetical protein